jgi:hypothetical protein
VVQFEMRSVSGRGFSRAETKTNGDGLLAPERGVSKKLRCARDRISEFVGTPEDDALTRIFVKLHHYPPTAILAA